MTRMICKNCGLEADDYIYCVECGSKMVELEQSGANQESEADAHDVPGQEESETQADQLEMPKAWTEQGETPEVQGEQLQAPVGWDEQGTESYTQDVQTEQLQAPEVQGDQLEMPEAWTEQGDVSYAQDVQGDQFQVHEGWDEQGQRVVDYGDQIQQTAVRNYQSQTPDAWDGQGQPSYTRGGMSDTASYRNPVDGEPPLSSPVKSDTPKKSTIAIGAAAAVATIALVAAIFILGQPFKQSSNNPPQTSVAPQSQSPSSTTNNGTNTGQTTQSPTNGVSSPTSTPQDNVSSSQNLPPQSGSGNSQNSSANTSNTEGREGTAHAGQQGQTQSPSGASAGSETSSGNNNGGANSGNANSGNANSGNNGGNANSGNNGGNANSGNANSGNNGGANGGNANSGNNGGANGGNANSGNKTDPGTGNGNKTDPGTGNGNKTDPGTGGVGGAGPSQPEPITLVAQPGTTPSREYAGESSNVGNLANGGQLASSGSDIYYAKPEDGKEWVTKSIVRTQADGKKKDEIYKGSSDTKSIDNINAFKDRLVFTETRKDKTYVMSMDSKGGNKVVIDECDKGSLCQVNDGWIYYQHNGTVYRCDPFGQGQTEIRQVGDDQWYAVGEKFIFTIEDNSTTVYLNIIGTQERLKEYTASNGCYIASACFKSDYILPILEKSKTSKTCSVIEITGNGGPIPRWSGEGDFESISSYDDGITLIRKNAANDYSIFTLRGPDADYPRDRTREWDSELKSVAEVKNKGEVRYLSSFPGNIAFASVNNNSKCGWNAVPVAGGDIRAL